MAILLLYYTYLIITMRNARYRVRCASHVLQFILTLILINVPLFCRSLLVRLRVFLVVIWWWRRGIRVFVLIVLARSIHAVSMLTKDWIGDNIEMAAPVLRRVNAHRGKSGVSESAPF